MKPNEMPGYPGITSYAMLTDRIGADPDRRLYKEHAIGCKEAFQPAEVWSEEWTIEIKAGGKGAPIVTRARRSKGADWLYPVSFPAELMSFLDDPIWDGDLLRLAGDAVPVVTEMLAGHEFTFVQAPVTLARGANGVLLTMILEGTNWEGSRFLAYPFTMSQFWAEVSDLLIAEDDARNDPDVNPYLHPDDFEF